MPRIPWTFPAIVAVLLAASNGLPLHAVIQTASPPPQDAASAILAAFERYDVVGMSAAHSNEKLDDFILSLVQRPDFPLTVSDIVVECGNRRYQALLDRYIAGEDVPIEDAQRTWRDTTVLMCGLSGFYHQFFPAIRALNRGLPPARRLRVLAGDPAVDWSLGDRAAVLQGADRNASIAAVMTTEVLARHRKALALIGVGHLFHDDGRGTAVSAYEKTYPGRTFVIQTHEGFGAFFDLERGHQLEARMRTWAAPSIVLVNGSWLADLDLPYFLWPFPRRMAVKTITDLVDAYLYVGPVASMTYERTPDAILNDASYIAELSRRFGVVDVEALRRRNLNRELFTPADRAEARQFAPGAECVGTYARKSGDAPEVEVDFRNGGLAARFGASKIWSPLAANGPSRYQTDSTTGPTVLEFDDAGGSVQRLTMTVGGSTKRQLVRVPGS